MKYNLIKTLLILLILNSFSTYSQSYEEWKNKNNNKSFVKYNFITKEQKLKCAKCYKTCNYSFVSISDFDFSNSDNPNYLERLFDEIKPYLLAKVMTFNLEHKCEKPGCEESYSGNHIWEVLDEKIKKDKMTFPSQN
jgi:hypothetical protein